MFVFSTYERLASESFPGKIENIHDSWLRGALSKLLISEENLESKIRKSDERNNIPRIPQHMAERVDFRNYYEPRIISIGPIHLPKEDLLQGKLYKDLWAAKYVQGADFHRIQEVHRMTRQNAYISMQFMYLDLLKNEKLASAYDHPPDGKMFATLALVSDGCCVLHLLEKSDNSFEAQEELEISIDKLLWMHQDLLIMDNQIPFQVLRLLCEDQERLEKCLGNFLQVHGIQTAPKLRRQNQEEQELRLIVQGDNQEEEGNESDPLHLLDYLRRALLMRDLETIHKDIRVKMRSWHLRKYRIGTIRELRAAGIRVRRHSNINSLYPTFNHGILYLPELTVDGSTAHIFLNLVAHEIWPGFRNNFAISSFIVFMSSLIDQPEDVKELRLAGVLINELANDKEVADLFNKMDTILVPETPLFAHIRDQIHVHFKSKRGKIRMLSWMGEASNTFFRSPWTIIALLAAVLGLVLTFIQTWFAIHPKSS
ncbi:hypothetical protein HN51_053314 [Arachis hypogaea]|uniref:UPF0481 protein n=1 Tax=Arachis hypogaea TaxID=3818 RepID=A0A444XC09_ARAHY|nr:uncharacterized protein LOC107616979 [Arachis ipaensis]XP_025675598.1 uncharacterized protein LOC112775912 [Arachis hypogaea]QHN75636.1 UPF0481 protein [Arachis hypogaea]RYQ87202.1 hypothetical protein Ahy_B09g094676 [Arachis hypogaea]